MSGIIGKKIGMTSIYDASGKNIPCTVIEAGPCIVTQVRTIENDGYEAIQLAFGEKKEKNTTKALRGHFAKANTTPKKIVAEFTRFEVGHQKKFGDVLTVDVFVEGEYIDGCGRVQTCWSDGTYLSMEAVKRGLGLYGAKHIIIKHHNI